MQASAGFLKGWVTLSAVLRDVLEVNAYERHLHRPPSVKHMLHAWHVLSENQDITSKDYKFAQNISTYLREGGR